MLRSYSAIPTPQSYLLPPQVALFFHKPIILYGYFAAHEESNLFLLAYYRSRTV